MYKEHIPRAPTKTTELNSVALKNKNTGTSSLTETPSAVAPPEAGGEKRTQAVEFSSLAEERGNRTPYRMNNDQLTTRHTDSSLLRGVFMRSQVGGDN